MRDTWIGSGIYSETLDRTIECNECDIEFTVESFFDDLGVCDERYTCPSCFEYIYYYEDRRDKRWEE